LNDVDYQERLLERALDRCSDYADSKEGSQTFDPANPRVPVTQKCLDADDYRAMVEAVLEGNLTHGPHAAEFERGLAKQFGVRHAAFCNSGSSANLLALAALMDESLGDARLKPGDEVVVCAAGFPTTVNPVVQLGLTPVFVDCELGTYNADMKQVYEAGKRSKVRAAMLAHTLGNPYGDRGPVANEIGYKWVVEDCCDALDSTYGRHHVGRFGTLATCSFYPAHHITTGEGGAVMTDSSKLDTIICSLRDWGRSCWCPPGADNTCGQRFDWCWSSRLKKGLPDGYDHKHVFARVGWNLKNTDIAAALGVSQLKKLSSFSEARRRNFRQLYAALEDLQDLLLLPKATPGSDPCWFGFPITLVNHDRRAVVAKLELAGIATRPLFAGNLTRQPAYRSVRYNVVGTLENADRVMRDSFYVGVHPGLNEGAMTYLGEQIRKAVTK
jgi:CDP-4-dehydro-6-deoxyglucose reductase, E1